MTKEELEKEAEEYAEKSVDGYLNEVPVYYVQQEIEQSYIASAEPREKQIADFEQKISVLLSCKNCPENKGGFICQKEYEDKCLAQKIQYIKELQEENTEAKNLIEELASSLSVVGECGKEECELINKAQKFINKPIF